MTVGSSFGPPTPFLAKSWVLGTVNIHIHRYIHPDGVVRYYDKKEAVGARLVRQVDKGRVAQEIYMLHENIIDNREIFLLTHRRVLYIQSNTVMGGWSSDWEYEYSAIQGIPTIEKEGGRWFIIIHPKVKLREMKLFIFLEIGTLYSD